MPSIKKSISKPSIEIAIVMGSDSDLPIMQESAAILDQFKIPYTIQIVSAHRTPLRMYHFAQRAAEEGIKVIIAGAGGAAHLPGMIASITSLPVIGVPIQSNNLQGLDSMLSIIQMPIGIPVATVAINGATNAGLLALRILAIKDKNLQKKITSYQLQLREIVDKKNEKLFEIGVGKYLKSKKNE